MDFPSIALSKEEIKSLEKSKTNSIPVSECERLLRLKLVYEEQDGLPGYAPYGLGICRITEFGIDYLAYRKQHYKDMWLQNAKIPIVVSAITTLMLNWLPKILPLIVQWLSNSQP